MTSLVVSIVAVGRMKVQAGLASLQERSREISHSSPWREHAKKGARAEDCGTEESFVWGKKTKKQLQKKESAVTLVLISGSD